MTEKLVSHTYEVRKITWIGVVVNLLLAGVKFVTGVMGNSQAVIADAFHSLSDLATDFAVLIGVEFWSAPPDEDHPYGHLRIEALVTVIIGIALLAVALGLAYKSLTTLREIHIRQTSWIAILGPALSIIAKEILYQWTIRVGSRIKSKAVVANAWHHRSDALSSIPALAAVAVSAVNPEWAFVDHIGAILISFFILKVSWDILVPTLQELSDRGASAKDCATIQAVSLTIPGVREVHAIRTRKFGSQLLVDMHMLVNGNISVQEGHQISEDVKDRLLHQGPNILDVVIHIEPFQ